MRKSISIEIDLSIDKLENIGAFAFNLFIVWVDGNIRWRRVVDTNLIDQLVQKRLRKTNCGTGLKLPQSITIECN